MSVSNLNSALSVLLLGIGQCSNSSVDLDIEPGSDSELREGNMGGTVEVDLEERGPETPSMVLMESKTNESSCPSWLRKVCATRYPTEVLLKNL